MAGARESGNAETYLRGQAQSLEQSVVVLQTLPKEGYLLSPPEPPQGLAVEEAEVFYPELHIPRWERPPVLMAEGVWEVEEEEDSNQERTYPQGGLAMEDLFPMGMAFYP